MKNLGENNFKEEKLNTFIKLLFLFFTAAYPLFAEVSASVDSKSVELGEVVTYSLHITGEKIKRPNITRICDTDVISTASQTSMQIINGAMSKSYTLSYKFVPQKSCKIEPTEIEIDGKTEASNEIEIEVKPVSGAKEQDFILTLSSEKKELFVGETFDLTLTFKQKNGSSALDSRFTPPELKGLWIKNESEPQKSQDDKYTTTKVVYSLSPQRAGELKIPKAQMQIASRENKIDGWGGWVPTIKWKSYFSNELDINVKPLPSGVSLVGDFIIEANVKTNEVNANEALDLIITVEGEGNLEDIKSFKPHIEGVAVFDEKIALEGTKLSQKIAFVAERDFVIPPFELTYFDIHTKETKSVYTKEIVIKVKNPKEKEELNIKRESTQSTQNSDEVGKGGYDAAWIAAAFGIGLFLGALLMIFKPLNRLKKEKKSSIKDPKVLLAKLLPYKEDQDVRSIVEKLERNIYAGEKIEIDKKLLKEIMKRYKID